MIRRSYRTVQMQPSIFSSNYRASEYICSSGEIKIEVCTLGLSEIDNLSEKLRKIYNYRRLIVYNGVEQLGDIIDVKDISYISRKLKS